MELTRAPEQRCVKCTRYFRAYPRPGSPPFNLFLPSRRPPPSNRQHCCTDGVMSSRPVSTGKMWTPLESRLPTSLLLTSRPGSAAAAVTATGAGAGDLATTTGGTPTVIAGGSEWGDEGGAEDPTVWNFSSWTNGGGSGGGNGHGSCGEGQVTAQERALFGRKPSPATVARSTSYAPRLIREKRGVGNQFRSVWRMKSTIDRSREKDGRNADLFCPNREAQCVQRRRGLDEMGEVPGGSP